MKTDSLFYKIFQDLPFIFFALLNIPESVTAEYLFTSQEVKQLALRLDGLFLPINPNPELPFYIVEVQFQPDSQLYSRLFTELLIYIRQYNPTHPWHLVVIYPDRQTERINELHSGGFLQLPNITRIYINELSIPETTALPVKLLKLITEPEITAPNLALELANQAREEIADQVIRENLINLLETIIVYKLPHKSREEIAAMFSQVDLKQTRFYQEVFTEGLQEGRQEERKVLIQRLAARGVSAVEIAQIVDLAVEEVEVTISQNNQLS
jgi:predicted transposase/invertase (TIGR01784 family)